MRRGTIWNWGVGLRAGVAAAVAAACLFAGAAVAQDKPDALADSAPRKLVSVTGNPAATTYTTGTGWLGRTLGLRDEWGVTLGGMWLADINLVAAGGVKPDTWSANSALFVGLGVDAEKLVGWRGAAFGAQFLQVNGVDSNGDAGAFIGYNGIVGQPPYQRTELFELWYEQALIKDVLKVRIGRSAPTLDFGNVARPVALDDEAQNIPAVSSLLFTTIFLNGAALHVLPGYYNPGNGVTVNFTPTKNFYVNLGVYDGNLARGIQTGINPPLFTGYYVGVGEIGFDWLLGEGRHPGQVGIGLWRQTGLLTAGPASEDGSNGFYVFGSQRVAYGVNPSVPNSSVSVFFQLGANSSVALPVTQSYTAGITGFSLVTGRPLDSMGAGVSWSRMNQNLFQRPSELMFQAYYQAHVVAAIFVQPTVTFIPEPSIGNTPPTLTTTMRLTVLF